MWSDDLTVGISEIDSQHRQLFCQLDQLLDACVAGRELAEVLRMLDFLDDYVKTHFDTEETLLQRHDFPGYENHRLQHVLMRDRIGQFRQELQTTGPTRDFVLRVNQLLIDWLKGHIRRVDREASEFLLKKMPPAADIH
ncbi:bacteriohemerythrin [Geobacter pickeringii]|uniref:Hemerythrin n=1 Tax=Geobacter pickeringii TaxID=345632 RepID=A0A0B5BJ77_9BACT|nr:bacteriohemerythrin [Geobacter pickeringii]AJE04116.1 hemerythrin [Geobacter pickeringii]